MHKKFELGDIFVLPDSPFRTHLFLTATEILGSTEWTQKPRWLQGTLRRITDPAFGVTGDRLQVGSCGAERRVAKERHHQGRCGATRTCKLGQMSPSGGMLRFKKASGCAARHGSGLRSDPLAPFAIHASILCHHQRFSTAHVHKCHASLRPTKVRHSSCWVVHKQQRWFYRYFW